jgi:protein-S-isoprenylcysteine O-methyltransferase Ste14
MKLKLTAGIAFNLITFSLALFPAAGTLDWWRAWVILGLVTVGSIASVADLARDERGRALLAERMKPPIQKGQPLADKILLPFFIASFYGLLVFSSLDVFHLHLMGEPGALVSSVGLALTLGGWAIAYLSMRENVFATGVVRHQEERNQTVVDTGVYAIVRHPMYVGGALFAVGLPLWLGSYAGALAAVVPIAMMVVRIRIEERLLRRELPGYVAYTERVRYRLVPFVW